MTTLYTVASSQGERPCKLFHISCESLSLQLKLMLDKMKPHIQWLVWLPSRSLPSWVVMGGQIDGLISFVFVEVKLALSKK